MLLVMSVGAGQIALHPDAEAAFLLACHAAMNTMMAGMDGAPRGDVDRDFASQMIPHHQGAIDMAKAELLYGRNERLRRLAQEIIIEQQSEIAVMKRAAAETSIASSAGER